MLSNKRCILVLRMWIVTSSAQCALGIGATPSIYEKAVECIVNVLWCERVVVDFGSGIEVLQHGHAALHWIL